MRFVLLAVLLLGCKKKASDLGGPCSTDLGCLSKHCLDYLCTSGEVGAKCKYGSDCNSPLSCFRGGCRGPAIANEECNSTADCTKGLFCVEYKCLDDAAYDAHEKRRRDSEKQQEAVADKRMLEQSGVEVPAEANAPPPAGGTRVRTVSIKAKGRALAACKREERLIGGGCETANVRASYPSGHGAEDTVGARWNCTGGGADDVTAYALCTKVP